MPKVTLVKEKTEFEVPVGANLRDECRKRAVEVYPGLARYLNCFGHGQCGTCKVLVKKGKENLSPKTVFEKVTFGLRLLNVGFEDEMRLSCQCKVIGDVTIETQPEMNLSGENFWQKPYPNK